VAGAGLGTTGHEVKVCALDSLTEPPRQPSPPRAGYWYLTTKKTEGATTGRQQFRGQGIFLVFGRETKKGLPESLLSGEPRARSSPFRWQSQSPEPESANAVGIVLFEALRQEAR